jgi:EmrB/QacA subfamily drug resistance transporter
MRRKHSYLLILLCLANFMTILDSQIVLAALPSMERHLGVSPQGGQWILTANLLTFGGLLLLGGRAADLLGRRKVFQAGTLLFLIVSLLSGLAPNGGMLVSARFVHGVAAALMAPTALSILATTFREGAARNKALAAWSAIGGTGATSGLLLGGALTQSLGWRWIFFINVPVAAIMLALSPFLLPENAKPVRRTSFDLAGAVTITGALLLLVYAVVQAPSVGWTAASTIAWIVVSGALLVAFTVIEARSKAPLLPLAILRSPRLSGGNLGTIIMTMTAFGFAYLIALYTQEVLGYSPLRYGLSTSAMPLAAVAGSFIAQFAITRTSIRLVGTTSMLLMGAGLLLLIQIPVTGVFFRDLFPGLILFGLGLGSTSVACQVGALADVAERDSGLASGINSASFQIGGAIGVALIATVVASAAPRPTPAALTGAFHDGFAACAVITAVGALVTLTMLRKPKAVGAAEAAVVSAAPAYSQADPQPLVPAEQHDNVAEPLDDRFFEAGVRR